MTKSLPSVSLWKEPTRYLFDGRYYNKTKELADYFSEYALIKYRCKIEIEYLVALFKFLKIDLNGEHKLHNYFQNKLKDIYILIKNEDILKIKNIEQTVNHDVKAVEMFIKEKVNDIRERIKQGTYHVDSEKIADSILREAIKDKLSTEM